MQSYRRFGASPRLQQLTAIANAQFRLANLIWTEALVNLNRSNLTLAEAIKLLQHAQSGEQRIGTESADRFYKASNQALALYQQAASSETSLSKGS